MRVLAASLVAAALLAPATTPVFAHGGQYRVPAGEVPPDSRQPEDPPPPDTGPNGTPTPPETGPEGTPTPPPDSTPGTPTPPPDGTPDKPGTGGPVPPPAGPGGPGTSSGKRTARKGASFDSWQYWWVYNRDDLLALRRFLRDGGAGSRGGAFGEMAEGGAEVVGGRQDLTAAAVARRVVPLLEKYAADPAADFDIRSSAVIGLARIGRRQSLPLFLHLVRPGGTERVHGVVEESAALAIGILGDRSPEIRAFLAEVAADRAARTRTRCFAAFSLGLLGGADGVSDPASLAALRGLVTDPAEPNREIAASALVAMGHLGDPAALPELLAWLKAERAGAHPLDDLQLSCAAAAVGRIARGGAGTPGYPALVESLCEQLRRRNRVTRYSAAIALGQIGSVADDATRRSCVSLLSDVVAAEGRGADAQTVHFALISLGRIAGASGEEVRGPAVARLRRTFEGKQAAARSFAALALGLASMDRPAAERIQAADSIRQALGRAGGDVEARGAHCIALGLMKDPGSLGVLDGIARAGGDARLRGAAILALGLVGDPSSAPVVRAALLEKQDKDLRVEAAVAAGLLRDGEAVDVLVGILQDPKSSQFAMGSAASALGRIGDQRAVEPLARILEDAGSPALTRALACVALGQIGDRGDVPVLSRVSKDVNYRAYFDAIGELLTIL